MANEFKVKNGIITPNAKIEGDVNIKGNLKISSNDTVANAVLDLGIGTGNKFLWYNDDSTSEYHGTKGGVYLDMFDLQNNTTIIVPTSSESAIVNGTYIIAKKDVEDDTANSIAEVFKIELETGETTISGDLIVDGINYTKQTPTQLNEAVSLDYINNNLSFSATDYVVPYSVNKSNRSNGYADIINKVSDTEISFKIDNGTTYENMIVTYPDCEQEIIVTSPNITGISGDGIYTVIKEKGVGQTIATTASVSEGYVQPIGTDGDYWLDIGVKPYVPYKKVAGTWNVVQYVKIGEFSVVSSVIGTPKTYALNGVYYDVVAGTSFTTNFNHVLESNVGSDNDIIVSLYCKSDDNGFTIGDTIQTSLSEGNAGTGTNFYGIIPATQKNTFSISVGTSLVILTSSGGLLVGDPSKWDVKITCKRRF